MYQTRCFRSKTRPETDLSIDRVTIVINRTLGDFVFLPFNIHLFPQFLSIELNVYVNRRCEEIGHGGQRAVVWVILLIVLVEGVNGPSKVLSFSLVRLTLVLSSITAAPRSRAHTNFYIIYWCASATATPSLREAQCQFILIRCIHVLTLVYLVSLLITSPTHLWRSRDFTNYHLSNSNLVCILVTISIKSGSLSGVIYPRRTRKSIRTAIFNGQNLQQAGNPLTHPRRSWF